MRLSEHGTEAGRTPGLRFSWPTLLAGLAFTGDLLFWHLSIVTTSVANATFFATTAPVWVVAFGWLIFGERARVSTLAGLALCLAGGAALLAHSLQFDASRALGDLFGLVTGVFFGLYFLAVQEARKEQSAARVTFEATILTAALLFLVAYAFEHAMLPHKFRRLARAPRDGLDQPCRRAGAAGRRARAAAGGVLVAGDLSRGDRRGGLCLPAARRTRDRSAGARAGC